MADQSIQIGNKASFERAAAIAIGARSVANHKSNNMTNVPYTSIVLHNHFGGRPLAESQSRLVEDCSAVESNTNPGVDHTQAAIRCFRIMNDQLHQDMLDVGVDPAQFLTNAEVITRWPGKREEKISKELQDACIHWSKHIREVREADRNNGRLIRKFEKFVNKHLPHWIEALSWIDKLSSADMSLQDGIVFLRSNPTSSNSLKLLSEGQRLITDFGALIAQAALQTYRTALPLTPNESLLYQKYSREMRNNLCRVLSWRPEDSHGIMTRSQHKQPIKRIVFSSQPATYFASWSGESVNMWDSTNGMGHGCFTDKCIALADNFSAGASSQENLVFFRNFPDPEAPPTKFPASNSVLKIAVSFDGRRIAAGSCDSKIRLWDGTDGLWIRDIDEFECHNQEHCQLIFSPTGPAGARLAFSSGRGGLELRNAINGKHIVNLIYDPSTMHVNLVFSCGGSRLASLVKGKDEKHILTVWNVVNGRLIGNSAESVGSMLAISTDGLLIATGGDGYPLQLWSQSHGDRNRGDLLSFDTPPDLNLLGHISCLAFSHNNVLIVGLADADSVLYDVKQGSIIIRIPKHNPSAASFSPDCTRLGIGYSDGTLHLWDISGFQASHDISRTKSASVSILLLSPDCSRLASGFEDGTIRLWDTKSPSQPLAIYKNHLAKVTALAFRLDGGPFASGAADGTIRLWDSDDAASTDFFQFPTRGELTSVAFSGLVLAAATEYETNLWNIVTGERGLLCKPGSTLLAFSNPNHEQSSLLASFNKCDKAVRVWDIFANTCVAQSQFSDIQTVEKLVFTSDNSQLAGIVNHDDGSDSFWLFNLNNKLLRYLQANEYSYLCPMPRWLGIPVWLQYSGGSYVITGFFSEDSERYSDLKMVVLPKHLVVNSCKRSYGSRMFALPSKDGRILLFKSLY